jgi:hypothetical protein
MGKLSWIAEQPSRLKREGIRDGVSASGREFIRYALGRIEPLDVRGEPVYERDWDVLILLDGCRLDLMESVSDEYGFVPDPVPAFRSLASTSNTWMERNFTDEYKSDVRNTCYVTANPFSDDYVEEARFSDVDEVWQYAWDDDLGTVPARSVTNRTISMARSRDCGRLIVHYMQPHFPSVPEPVGSEIELDSFESHWDSVWDRLCSGDIAEDVVWESYRENLRYVLDDVELLLENLDAGTVVISADHGNAMGQWGQYGHPAGVPIAPLRNVPWVETTATDTGSYDPDPEEVRESSTTDEVRSRLKDLGYA